MSAQTRAEATDGPVANLAAWQAADESGRAQLEAAIDARIDAARARVDALSAELAGNAAALAEDGNALDARAGDLNALFATVRQAAADAASLRRDSLVAAQLGMRDALARRVAAPGYVPAITDLEALQQLYLEEMAAAGRVVRFEGQVVSPQGIEQAAEVVRVGVFTLLSGGQFLAWDPGTGTLQTLVQQPRARHRALAEAVTAASEGMVPMAVDPTAGAMLDLLARQPSIVERIQQGGIIGYVIIALGAVGLALALWRLVATVVIAGR
ncbi:MAG: hypothetical protein AAFN78_05035, partial [Pseudomonadota bacterium]